MKIFLRWMIAWGFRYGRWLGECLRSKPEFGFLLEARLGWANFNTNLRSFQENRKFAGTVQAFIEIFCGKGGNMQKPLESGCPASSHHQSQMPLSVCNGIYPTPRANGSFAR